MDTFERITILDNEVQAELIDAILREREIPHMMVSFYDSAYDGLYQAQRGWGSVNAPPQFRAEILTILEDVKQQAQAPPAAPEADGESGGKA